MTAVTDTDADTDVAAVDRPDQTDTPAPARTRALSVAASASLLTGGAFAMVWFWIPLALLVIALTSIPSVIGFVLAGVVFIYLMRGVDHIERVRSEAVFGMGIAVPPRRLSHYSGLQRWAHQQWLDVSSARFWKATAHHYLRLTYDMLVTGLAFVLLSHHCFGHIERIDGTARHVVLIQTKAHPT